ncbi:unnamed protein product, partial [Darwinula stevensoni]
MNMMMYHDPDPVQVLLDVAKVLREQDHLIFTLCPTTLSLLLDLFECQSRPSDSHHVDPEVLEHHVIFIRGSFATLQHLRLVESPRKSHVCGGTRITLKPFPGLEKLELCRTPFNQLKDLKEVRHKLKLLSIHRPLTPIISTSDVLVCSADGLISFWEELKELRLTACQLVSVTEECWKYTPNLRCLDLSHNCLEHASLPSASSINLSYNKLMLFPSFSVGASSRLQILLLRSNLLESLNGMESLVCMKTLDVSHNLLMSPESLEPLRKLSCLEMLMLDGNPISYRIGYRNTVAGTLHQSASKRKVLLDGVELSEGEQEICLSENIARLSVSPLLPLPCFIQGRSTLDDDSLSDTSSRREAREKRPGRRALIRDQDLPTNHHVVQVQIEIHHKHGEGMFHLSTGVTNTIMKRGKGE